MLQYDLLFRTHAKANAVKSVYKSQVLADHKELPLYGSGGFRFLWDTKFDSGMVAFLDCLQQFKEEMEKVNAEFRLPYRMMRGKLEDAATGTSLSIK